MEAAPEDLTGRQLHRLLLGSILPRPIGWISTVNEQGQPNLAPFSHFNVVCFDPPHVMFAPTIRGTDGSIKDTLRNVRVNGEFVVNIVTEELAQAMNVTATEFPPEVNEFEAAELTASPSSAVAPPRVDESPMHLECKVVHIYDIGDAVGGGSVVIGEVVYVHVDERVLLDNGRIDLTTLKPIGRMVGKYYIRSSDMWEMERLPSQLGRKAKE